MHNILFQLQLRAHLAVQIKKISVRSKTFLYDSIWLKNFNFCQKSYGNKTRIIFFYTKNLFPVIVLGQGRYLDQNLLRYDQRFSNIVFLKLRNFGVANLLWAYNGFRFIFGRFFVFVRLDQKLGSHWLVSVSMNKNGIKIRKLVVCKVFHYIPSNQEGIIFLTRLIFIWNLISRLKRFSFEFRCNW